MKNKIFLFFEKYVYLFSALFTFLLFAIIFKCNNLYPFGSLTISWCDMDQQTIPLLCDFKDVLSGKEGFFLSLKNAGGMNFYGVYFFNLSSPFTYLIAFFDKSQMPLAVNLMVILKLTCAALTFALWLKYSVKNCSPFLIIPISLSYAFSGYAMMYYQILSWLDTLYVFPLLLIGLNMIGEGKSNILYVISLFACVLCHFYLSWAVIIFVCLYAGVYCFLKGERAGQFAKSFIVGSIISAFLSCIILIPCFLQYTHSMRGGDLISGLINEQMFPPIETSFPTFFGMFLTLPFALYFSKKSQISVEGTLLILMAIPVFIEPISMAWQTYNYMSFPTRYGFITIAIGLGLATKKLSGVIAEAQEGCSNEKHDKLLSVIRIVSSVVLVLLVVVFALRSYDYFTANKEVLTAYSRTLWGDAESLKKLFSYYAIFLIAGIILLALIKLKSIHKVGVYAVIGGLCVIEAIFSCGVYMVTPSNEYTKFNRAYQINELIQDDDFYRLKTESKYFDVNLIGAMGYNSMSHYTSLNRESYMLMAKSLGYSSYWMEVNSNGGTIFTDALMRNKYTINKGYSKAGTLIAESKNYKIYQNNQILPFGFLIEGDSSANTNLTLPRWQIQDNICKRLLGVSIHHEYSYSKLNGVSLLENANKNYSFNLDRPNGSINYSIKIEEKRTLYFDLFDRYSNSLRESTYDTVERIHVQVNGLSIKNDQLFLYPNQGRNGCLCLGTYEDATVDVKVYLKKNINANTFGVFSIDNEMLESAVNQAIGGHFDVKRSEIKGSITATNSGQYAFFCLPYDEGYRARVNGKKVEVVSVNDFVAVPLEVGKNEVEIGFVPEGFWLALTMFIIGVAMLICYLLFGKKLDEISWLNKVCIMGIICLFALVIGAVYIFPPIINLTKFF